jgi:putative membrane protein
MSQKTKLVFGVLFTVVVLQLVFGIISWVWVRNQELPFQPHMFQGGMMPFGMIGMGVFWLLILYFAYVLIDNSNHKGKVDAIALLNERLALGEISIEEYDRLMQRVKEKTK